MKLPRYSATTLPSTAVLSPQAAAAAAAAPAQFGENLAGAAGKFTMAIYTAEQEEERAAAIVDVQRSGSALLSDEKYEKLRDDPVDFSGRPIVDELGNPVRGKPTEQTLAEDFRKWEEAAQGRIKSISSKSVKKKAQIEVDSMVATVRENVIAKANGIRVRRAEANSLETGSSLEASGLWQQARDHYRQSYDNGVGTAEQLQARLKRIDKAEAEFPYQQALLSNDPDEVEAMMLIASQDMSLGTAQTGWIKALRTYRDNLDNDYEAQDESQKKKNAVRYWSKLSQLSNDEIMAADLSPEAQIAMIKMKRSDARGGSAPSDPNTVNWIFSMISMYQNSPTKAGYNTVMDRISQEAADGRLVYEDALQMQRDLAVVEERINKGTGWTESRSLIRRRITGVTDDKILYDRYQSSLKADKVVDYANKIEQEYMVVSRNNPNFDLFDWWMDSEERIIGEMDRMLAVPPTLPEIKSAVMNQGFAAAMAIINDFDWADEAAKQRMVDSARIAQQSREGT